EHLFLVLGEDLRADRNLDHEIVGALAGAVLAHAVGAAPGLEVLGVAEVDQRIEPRHRAKHDVPALAAVAAVGPAVLDELLAPEAHRPRPAAARLHVDFRLIEEVHEFGLGPWEANVS